MRLSKPLLAAAVMVVLGSLTAPAALDANTPAGGDTCVMSNSGAGSVAIKATVEVYVPDAFNLLDGTLAAGPYEANVTYRLERSGVIGFFRTRLSLDAIPNSHVDFLCLVLPHEDNTGTAPPGSPADVIANYQALNDLKVQIGNAFGTTGRNYCITGEKAITKAEPLSSVQIPGTTAAASLVDATIQALAGNCN